MMSYIDEDIPIRTYDALTQKNPTIYFERFTKGSAATMQRQDLYQERRLGQGTTGLQRHQ